MAAEPYPADPFAADQRPPFAMLTVAHLDAMSPELAVRYARLWCQYGKINRERGRFFVPTYAELAKVLKCARSTAFTTMQLLTEGGWLAEPGQTLYHGHMCPRWRLVCDPEEAARLRSARQGVVRPAEQQSPASRTRGAAAGRHKARSEAGESGQPNTARELSREPFSKEKQSRTAEDHSLRSLDLPPAASFAALDPEKPGEGTAAPEHGTHPGGRRAEDRPAPPAEDYGPAPWEPDWRPPAPDSTPDGSLGLVFEPDRPPSRAVPAEE